jgi:hypothetical protein
MMVASHLEYKVINLPLCIKFTYIIDILNAAYEILNKVPLNIQPTIRIKKNNKKF